MRWLGVRRMAGGSLRIWRGRGFLRAADAEAEVAEEPASLVAEVQGEDADPQTVSEAQTEVEAAGERSQG